MPIILAIEPDRRQATHLAAIVRQRVGAELILADTTEGALDAIGNRIPDMVLVPAFLSPQDDAALAAALRVIAAAAHVRTLTIPVLSSGERRPAPGGILAKWRRARAESPAPDGCDPAVFAEQITAYLKEAAAERAELDVDPDETVTAEIAPIVEAPPIELATPMVEALESAERAELDVDPDETVAAEIAPIVEALPIALATPVVEAVESMVLPTALPLAAAPAPADDDETAIEDDEGALELSAELTFLSEEKGDAYEAAGDERVAGEPVCVYTIETAVGEPAPVAEEGVVEETEPIAPRPTHLEWSELVASLRQDIERRRAKPVPVSSPPAAARAASPAAVRGSQYDPRQKRRGKQAKPIQDEWGFFDPEQCGFAALLAKLEEITVSTNPADDDVRRPA